MDKGIINILKEHGCLYMIEYQEPLLKAIDEYYKQELALQLRQTGVMARCYEDYIGKKFIYKSKITRHNTIFKVIAHFERCGKTVLVSENNNAYYLHEVRPYNEP